MKSLWILIMLLSLNNWAFAQIEKGSIVSGIGGSFSYKNSNRNPSKEASNLYRTSIRETSTLWKITAQGRYFHSKHWQTGLFLSYALNQVKEKYTYNLTHYYQPNGKPAFNQTKQNTYTYKAGPSIGFLSGSKFRTSLFCNLVPYIFYYDTALIYENNLGKFSRSSDGLSYGILLQPAIWYSINDKIILEFTPLELSMERPVDKDAARELSVKAAFQAISFSINFLVK